MYILYVNEVTALSKIMDTCYYQIITLKEQICIYGEEIKHFTLNYIDDSSNVIASKDTSVLQNYINDFFLLLEHYYNANMLTLNSDKTKLLVTCKARYRKSADIIKLKASNYIIEQVAKIKVLGIFITNTLDNQANINNITHKINYR